MTTKIAPEICTSQSDDADLARRIIRAVAFASQLDEIAAELKDTSAWIPKDTDALNAELSVLSHMSDGWIWSGTGSREREEYQEFRSLRWALARCETELFRLRLTA